MRSDKSDTDKSDNFDDWEDLGLGKEEYPLFNYFSVLLVDLPRIQKYHG